VYVLLLRRVPAYPQCARACNCTQSISHRARTGDVNGDVSSSDGVAGSGGAQQEPTGLPLMTLQRVGRAICSTPPGFNAHPDVRFWTVCTITASCTRTHADAHIRVGEAVHSSLLPAYV
jgi:2-oxoglutarate dehydrogenase complex dehydrogenase (E1) component-like enzyme